MKADKNPYSMMKALGKVQEPGARFNSAKDVMEAAAQGQNPGTQFIPASAMGSIRDLGISPQQAMVPGVQQAIQSLTSAPVPTKFVSPRG